MSDTPRAGSRSPVIRVFDCHLARPVATGGYEFLLLRRASNKIYAGSWRMVGGKLTSEETAWQACLREVGEETNLSVQRLLAVPYVNRFYEWQHDRINDIPVFVAVTVAPATIAPLESRVSPPIEPKVCPKATWLAKRTHPRTNGRVFPLVCIFLTPKSPVTRCAGPETY